MRLLAMLAGRMQQTICPLKFLEQTTGLLLQQSKTTSQV
jgi:hypothetical protein